MVIMTLELWYIFKDCIIKSAYLQFASVKFLKIAEMIDIIVENTHAKNQGGSRNRFFALKMFCIMKKKKI